MQVAQLPPGEKPIHSDASLRNISTGVNAHSTVSADNAGDVGNAILVSMEGKMLKSTHSRGKIRLLHLIPSLRSRLVVT